MKKISLLLILIGLLLMPIYSVKALTYVDFDEFSVKVKGTSKSDIELYFLTDEPLENLEIWIFYDKSGDKKDLIYRKFGSKSDRCEIISEGFGPNENEKYVHHFIFHATEKITTFEFDLNYFIGENEIRGHRIYVTDGNPNIEDEVFSFKNAIIIGIISTIIAGCGSYIIVKNSEKNVQINDEE